MTVKEYNSCVDEYADKLYRFVLKNVRDEDKARDVVQDTFEKVWMKVKDVAREKAKSYLFTVAYNTMIDQIRREKFQTPLEESHAENVVTTTHFTDIKRVLEKALGTLNEIQRSVILLRDYEGYSYEEIGRITGLSESQVKVYIYRARLSLKTFIGKPDNVI